MKKPVYQQTSANHNKGVQLVELVKNIYEKEINFNRLAYIVTCDGIEEATLREFCLEAGQRVTTPEGVNFKIHTRGRELWTWGDAGNTPQKIGHFVDVPTAEKMALASYYLDLINNSTLSPVYFTEEDATQAFSKTYEQ